MIGKSKWFVMILTTWFDEIEIVLSLSNIEFLNTDRLDQISDSRCCRSSLSFCMVQRPQFWLVFFYKEDWRAKNAEHKLKMTFMFRYDERQRERARKKYWKFQILRPVISIRSRWKSVQNYICLLSKFFDPIMICSLSWENIHSLNRECGVIIWRVLWSIQYEINSPWINQTHRKNIFSLCLCLLCLPMSAFCRHCLSLSLSSVILSGVKLCLTTHHQSIHP